MRFIRKIEPKAKMDKIRNTTYRRKLKVSEQLEKEDEKEE